MLVVLQSMLKAGLLLSVAVGFFVPSVSLAQVVKPERIISLGSDVTEILFGLGLGSQVVAVDSTSRYPESVTQLPDVGYLRSLSAEGVLSLSPSVIVANERAGPAEVIEQLRDSGVRIIAVEAPHSVDGIGQKIEHLARVFDQSKQGQRLLSQLQTDLDELGQHTALIEHKRPSVFVLSASQSGVSAGGKNTAADAAIRLIGLQNTIRYQGYKTVSPEALLLSPPDVVLTMPHTLQQLGGEQGLRELNAFALTPLANNQGHVVAIDGSALLAFGPRAAKEALRVAKRVYPSVPSTAQRVEP